eukprot:TRINITY_DN7953_c0_g1_i1.p1 TRINITY_DN7953_c0_g1~~TRINITY_DN7953_c0_g1_i1.p1  ORF type:complete len:141 (-),score=38.74 TRINITY_DN7953_c0_g1_i1:11-433(-)
MEDRLTLVLLKDTYSIYKFNPKINLSKINHLMVPNSDSSLFSFTVTKDEISIILDDKIKVDIENEDYKIESDWKVFKIKGNLDFGLIGILAKISTCLAERSISIFALSTYLTDYIFVKNNKLDESINALKSGYYITNEET